MKRIHLLALLFLFPVYLSAQSFTGYLTDNYNGVHGLILNPANIADSPRALDINFLTFSAFAENDYYAISFGELFSSDSDFDSNTMISASENNNFLVNLDIMGPSFMFNFSKKHSLAIFSRARVLANITEINGLLLENFIEDFDENEDFIADEGNLNINLNGWAELGATLGFTLYDNNDHFLKGGVSVKYLQGLGNASASGTDVFFDYDADGTALPNNETTGSINSRGTFTYSNTDNLEGDVENLELLDDANGLGFDFGFVYEWRPEKQDEKKDFNEKVKKKRLYERRKKYKLKLGVSLTDVGSIDYKNVSSTSYNLDAQNINEEELTNADDFEEALKAIYTFEDFDENQKVQLPTALHLELDYKITRGLYLNANANISMVDAVTANTSSLPSSYILTPRFENRWLGIYTPIGIREYTGFTWGAGLRLGPIFIGSGSLFSVLLGDNSQTADAYFGFKIPINSKK